MMQKQLYDKDCFLCCLVMATSIPYNEAAEKWGYDLVAHVADNGLIGREYVIQAFEKLGLIMDVDYKVLYLSLDWGSVGFTKNMLWGRRACLQIKSKNYRDKFHIVYWDGQELFDPSNKLTYIWEEVEPIYIWLFNER